MKLKIFIKEHKCVLDSCRVLEMEGFKVTYLGVKKNGIIDLNELEQVIVEWRQLPVREVGRLLDTVKIPQDTRDVNPNAAITV